MRIFSDIENDGSAAASSTDSVGVRERIRANLSGVGATIALASARGGVGKSMLAVNIAAAWAMKGRKVAIVDADLNSPSSSAAAIACRSRQCGRAIKPCEVSSCGCDIGCLSC